MVGTNRLRIKTYLTGNSLGMKSTQHHQVPVWSILKLGFTRVLVWTHGQESTDATDAHETVFLEML